MYITSWNSVPVGSTVIEDTYNEVYQVFMKDGEKWLKQIGWQYGNKEIPADNERPCDFDPACIYDQPWIVLGGD